MINNKIKENVIKNKYWIWYSLLKSIGTIRKIKLLEKYKNPEIIYKLNKEKLKLIEGIGEKTSQLLIEEKNKYNIKKYIEYMINNNIDIIPITSEYYPCNLKEIYDPPCSLYIKGNKNILNDNKIAIIGCREASEYGIEAAKYFSYKLSERNITIVSGLAKGIDSISHIGSLEANGNTIGVIGSGLDIIYPKENINLYERIIKNNGCIISEYPIGTKINKMNFPARNRIISGISNGIIVVEAKEKSGTLITVDFALEQGRDVYVVPGNINQINSIGTNKLIKEGARVLTDINDIDL